MNRSFHLRKAFLGIGVFVSLIFSISNFAFASESFQDQFSETKKSEDNPVFLAGPELSFSQNPFDSSLPEPIPGEPEESDEEEKQEKEDTSDEDWEIVNKSSKIHQQGIAQIQSAQFCLAFQNRKTIPFFILFQSWKSFLS